MPPKAKAKAKAKAKSGSKPPAAPSTAIAVDANAAAELLTPAPVCRMAASRRHDWKSAPADCIVTKSGNATVRVHCAYCECYITVASVILPNSAIRWSRQNWIPPRSR